MKMPYRMRRRLTLLEAVAWLEERRDGGAECPCCEQFAKVYKRKLTSTMTYALILIYKYFQGRMNGEWLHVPSYLNGLGTVARGGDYAKLEKWGLLEDKPGQLRDDGSRRGGLWRITQDGIDFINDELEVPKHVYIYGGETLTRPATEYVSVKDALGDRFNYAELMEAK